MIVESEQSYAVPLGQNVEAPQTIGEGTLKPFNSDSVYIQNNQEVYRGGGEKPNAFRGLFGRKSSQ